MKRYFGMKFSRAILCGMLISYYKTVVINVKMLLNWSIVCPKALGRIKLNILLKREIKINEKHQKTRRFYAY